MDKMICNNGYDFCNEHEEECKNSDACPALVNEPDETLIQCPMDGWQKPVDKYGVDWTGDGLKYCPKCGMPMDEEDDNV